MDDRLTDLQVRELVARIASGAPIPGGGSTAALSGALGAALLRMVVELTRDRADAAEHRAEIAEIGEKAARLTEDLLVLADEDSAAYAAVVDARRMPRATDSERNARTDALSEATRRATRSPLAIARCGEEVLVLAERLAPICNRNAVSDVGVGALLAAAAVRGGALNVRINLPSLAGDDPLVREASWLLQSLDASLELRERTLRETVEGLIG
jgi:formiminotetrahydrofolate cyclodeaminase